ncbi:hypothetical protein ACTXMB_15005 [Arthrobacter rhombi]|uniref:hypothetical protein n=1 Tax=Arthrobacter rhombi TaxID=71253 RepID=UPI003FD599FE
MDIFYWYDLGAAYCTAESANIPLGNVGAAIQGRVAKTRLWDGSTPTGTIEAPSGRGDDLYPKLRFPDGTWTRLDLDIHMAAEQLAIEGGSTDLWAQMVADSLAIYPEQTHEELCGTTKLAPGAAMGALGRLQRRDVLQVIGNTFRIAA